MTISEKSYKDLKEYWDFQRTKEYNWEKICHMCDNMESKFIFTNDNNGLAGITGMELKKNLWNHIKESEFEIPPKSWIPKDKKYRLWNEKYTLE